MRRQSSSKTKIIGGKLVTVYDYDYSNVCSNTPSQQLISKHAVALNNARLEAQKNKARAIRQTYTSVLSPEPMGYMDHKSVSSPKAVGYMDQKSVLFPEPMGYPDQKSILYSEPMGHMDQRNAAYGLPYFNCNIAIDNLDTHVLNAISSCSRYKLLTILSAMRRRDPHETGVLFKMDAKDVLDINNVPFKDQNVLESLFNKYEVSPNAIDYRRMWKFVMDCYADKDDVEFTKSQNRSYCMSPQLHRNTARSNDVQLSQQYSNDVQLSQQYSNDVHLSQQYHGDKIGDKTKESVIISPGLKAELEFGLRHYARSNDGCVDLKVLQDRLETMDPYVTGKLLHKEVLSICKDYLRTINFNVLNASISMCDVDRSGLVDYNLFLKLLRDVQPTYLPPIVDVPLGLSNQLLSRQQMRRLQSPIHQVSDVNQFTLNNSLDLNNNETNYSNVKLEESGMLGLNLSDFETEIHSRKSPRSTPQTKAKQPTTPQKLVRPSTYRKDKCDNINTYSLLNQPPPSVIDKENIEEIDKKTSGISLSAEGKNSNCESVSTNSLTPSLSPNLAGVSPKSPRETSSKTASSRVRSKKSNRKQWHKSVIDSTMDNSKFSPQSCSLNEKSFVGDDGLSKEDAEHPSAGKWWKNEIESGNTTPTGEHKTWCQSTHIQTIKGKRRRKKKLTKREHNEKTRSSDKYDLESSNTECDKTDMDSELYTTTDYEVDDSSFVFDNKNVLKPSRSYVLDDKECGKHPFEQNDKSEYVEEKSDKAGPTGDEKMTKKEETRGGEEEEDEEKLHLECVSPPPENSSESACIGVNGKSFTVYPSASNITLEKSDKRDKKLYLEYVYGYGGSTMHCVSSGKLVYPVGNVVVVMDTEKLTQRFFKKHNAMVTCVTVHQDLVTVASAQRKADKKCVVYVWNCVDLSVASTIFFISSDVLHVSAMDFSKESRNTSLLATIQKCPDHQVIAIYDWKNSSLQYNVRTSNVSGMLFSHIDKLSFITYGKLGHVMFYKIEEGTLVGAGGDFGDLPVAKNIGCAILNKSGNLITGDTNGTIHIWQNELHRIDHCIQNAHKGPISSMVFDMQGYLLTSCAKDQTVISWDSQMKVSDRVSLPEAYIGTRAMCVQKDKLFVASLSNTLAKLVLNANGDPLKDSKDNIFPLCEGNPDITTGMAAHPSYREMVVTLCADGTVQMYNTDSKSVMWVTNVKGNGSCVAFHPCQEFIAIGCQDGSIHLISSTIGEFVDKFKDSYVPVSTLQFSPDGKHLACGFHDGQLVIYSFDENNKELEHCLSDHVLPNKIEAIDWTISGTVVRVQSSSFDLIYYDVSTKGKIENNKELLWSSNNCSISYETSGAWKAKDLFSGNPSDMVLNISPANNILAFSSCGLLYMVDYPWTKREAPYTSTPSGFEGANPRLCCAVDGGKLFVAFDVGGCLWQWKIS